MAKLTFYGGVGSVTGANFLFQTDPPATGGRAGNSKILVDCGLVQGSKFSENLNRTEFAYNPAEIDYLLVTHAHIDHIGRIPKLVKDGFRGIILSTPETKDLAELLLEDTVKILETEAQHEGVLPLYEAKDIPPALALWQTLSYHTKKDLKDGKCPLHLTPPKMISEENYFFRLSKYQDAILKHVENNPKFIQPTARRNEVIAFLKEEGAKDISISRPITEWGIPLPLDQHHIFWVWFDALVNYISGAHSRWPASLHLLAKDILRFHAAIWPGMLLAAGLPLPKTIFVHGFITVGGEKMSKTIGNVINPVEIVNKYGVDALRYYLLWDITPTGDGDFTYEKFEERYNSGLANGIGNLVARIAKLGETISPIVYSESDIIDNNRNTKDYVCEQYDKFIGDIKFNEALGEAFVLVYSTDNYINETKPWTLKGNDLKKVIINASFLIQALSELIEPFLPETAEKIRKQIKFVGDKIEIKKGDNIFPRK